MDGQMTEADARSMSGAADSGSGTAGDDDAGPSQSLRRLLTQAKRMFRRPSERQDGAAERLNDYLAKTTAEQQDLRSSEERALLQNVMKLRDLRVKDVMVPRADIVAVEVGASLETVLAAFREGAHSRLPVYRDTLDDPIGVVHLKELALSHGFGSAAPDGFTLTEHVRNVLFAPLSMRILSLLQRMQATRRHMALVIDEYGGVDGLVTIEDLIEQIVGDIEDEHDDAADTLWRREPSGAWLAEARAEIADFEEATGARMKLDDWDEDVDTLGGLVFMMVARVPSRGEVIAHPFGHEFEIVDADPRRIKRLRVRISDGAPQEDAAEVEPAEAPRNGAAAAARPEPGPGSPSSEPAPSPATADVAEKSAGGATPAA